MPTAGGHKVGGHKVSGHKVGGHKVRLPIVTTNIVAGEESATEKLGMSVIL